jgi:hypothetical protein
MLTKSEYNDWKSALQLKDALLEVNDRDNPGASGSAGKTVASAAGVSTTSFLSQARLRFPVFTSANMVFGLDEKQSKKAVLTVPGDTMIGSIIEFRYKRKRKFGLIVEPDKNSKKKAVYVKPITEDRYHKIKEEKPMTQKVVLNQKAIQKLNPTILDKILQLIQNFINNIAIWILLIALTIGLGFTLYMVVFK